MSPKEMIPVPEATSEKVESIENIPVPEQSSERIEDAENVVPVIAPTQADMAVNGLQTLPKDELIQDVEEVMEEGLGALFASLPEEAKPLFRKKGEEAAIEIAGIIRLARIKTSRILRLIRDWLLTIPKVNRFFLEQEAKIKTDRILEIQKEHLEKPRA